MNGQAELEVDDEVLDDPVEIPVEVPVAVDIADDSEIVWLLVPLACVSLGFELDGDSFEFEFPPLSTVLNQLSDLKGVYIGLLVGGLLQLLISGIGMQGKVTDRIFSFGN